MDRRRFLRNCSLLAAGTVAADQIDLLERITAPTSYSFGREVKRLIVLPIRATVRGDGHNYFVWLQDEKPFRFDHTVTVEKLDYVGEMPPEFATMGLPITSIKLPMQHEVFVTKGNTLTVQLPTPLGRMHDSLSGWSRDFYAPKSTL